MSAAEAPLGFGVHLVLSWTGLIRLSSPVFFFFLTEAAGSYYLGTLQLEGPGNNIHCEWLSPLRV